MQNTNNKNIFKSKIMNGSKPIIISLIITLCCLLTVHIILDSQSKYIPIWYTIFTLISLAILLLLSYEVLNYYGNRLYDIAMKYMSKLTIKAMDNMDTLETKIITKLDTSLDTAEKKLEQKIDNFQTTIQHKTIETHQNIITELTKDEVEMSVQSICSQAFRHKIGLVTCGKSIMNTSSLSTVAEESIKMFSLLGFEQELSKQIYQKISLMVARIPIFGFTAEHEDTYFERFANIFKDLDTTNLSVSEITTVLTTLAFQFTNPTNILNQKSKQAAQNIDALTKIFTTIEKLVTKLKQGKQPGLVEVAEIQENIILLAEELRWLKVMLGSDATALFQKEEAKRLQNFKELYEQTSRKINTLPKNLWPSGDKGTHWQLIVNQSHESLILIKKIEKSKKTRPTPVGVNLWGDTQIGKTEMSKLLFSKIKQQLAMKHSDIYPDAKEWDIWHIQDRDDYDTDYYGQKLVYADDAWKAKDNRDHRSILTFISGTPVGTVQAAIDAKGAPFQGLVYIASSNTLPKTSCTIENINALQERFPICIKVKKKEGAKVPSGESFDYTFNHLDLHVATMRDYVNNEYLIGKQTTIDGIVDMIVQRMIINYKYYQNTVMALRDIENQQITNKENLQQKNVPIIEHRAKGDELAPGLVIPTVMKSEFYTSMDETKRQAMLSEISIWKIRYDSILEAGIIDQQLVKTLKLQPEYYQLLRSGIGMNDTGYYLMNQPKEGDDLLEKDELLEVKVQQTQQEETDHIEKLPTKSLEGSTTDQKEQTDLLCNQQPVLEENKRKRLNCYQSRPGDIREHGIITHVQEVPTEDVIDYLNDTGNEWVYNKPIAVDDEDKQNESQICNELLATESMFQRFETGYIPKYLTTTPTANSTAARMAFLTGIPYTNEVIELQPWYKYMVNTTTQEPFVDGASITCRDHPFFLLTNLHNATITNQKKFNEYWNKQKLIKILIEKETWMWSPRLGNGNALYKIPKHLTEYLDKNPLCSIRKGLIYGTLEDHGGYSEAEVQHFEKLRRVFGIGDDADLLLSLNMYYHDKQAQDMSGKIIRIGLARLIGYKTLFAVSTIAAMKPFDYPTTKFQKTWNCFATPVKKINQIIDWARSSMSWLKNGINFCLLRLLEYFGIEVTPIWQHSILLASNLASDIVLISIGAMICYTIYKFILLLKAKYWDKKKEQTRVLNIQMRGQRGDYHADKKHKKRQTKNKNTKRLPMFTHRMKAMELFECSEDCQLEIGDEIEDVGEIITSHNDQDLEQILPVIENYLVEGTYKVSVLAESGHLCGQIYQEESDLCELLQIEPGLRVFKQTINLEDVVDFAKQYKEKFKNNDPNVKQVWGMTIKWTYEIESDKFLSDLETKIKRLKSLNYGGIDCDLYYQFTEKTTTVSWDLTFLTALINEKQVPFVKKDFKMVDSIRRQLLSTDSESVLEKVAENILAKTSEQSNMSHMENTRRKHMVILKRISQNDPDIEAGSSLAGLVSGDIVVAPYHLLWGPETDYCKLYKSEDYSKPYYLVKILGCQKERDIFIGRIVHYKQTPYNNAIKCFPGLELWPKIDSHLFTYNDWINVVPDQTVTVYSRKNNTYVGGKAHMIETQLMHDVERDQSMFYKNFFITLSVSNQIIKDGDCGTPITTVDKILQHKIVGFISAVVHNMENTIIATYVTLEDFFVPSIETRYLHDPFESFIDYNGRTPDAPSGVKVIGEFIGKNRAASTTSLKHWHKSPWSDEFEEVLVPAPLDPLDPRIKNELPLNGENKPSLLLGSSSIYGEQHEPYDLNILNMVCNKIKKNIKNKINNIRPCSNDIVQFLEEGLNPHPMNKFNTHIKVASSAGLPWSELARVARKDDMIDNIDGKLSFKNTPEGRMLYNRVYDKIVQGNKNTRVISFYASKLKDALIKKKYVEVGKVRVFQSVPVEKIIADACAYGNYKEAYSASGLNLEHAVGVTPHSMSWTVMADYLFYHPNVLDIDQTNFDKRLWEELIKRAYRIINEVIREKAPDQWWPLRNVLADESVYSWIVDEQTIYEVCQGNNSGEYLTTPINHKADEIMLFYCWVILTNNTSYTEYRSNTRHIKLGDDLVVSVSSKYAKSFNFLTISAVLRKHGHVITTGSKQQIETPFTEKENVVFLKRKFKKFHNIWLAPLDTTSIESPLVWTQILPHQLEIWYNLIAELIQEAMLHGEVYYNSFIDKLSKCRDPTILNYIRDLLVEDYETRFLKYLNTKIYANNDEQ